MGEFLGLAWRHRDHRGCRRDYIDVVDDDQLVCTAQRAATIVIPKT
jgi:hypothetical protein